jgi:serine/threonine-protein kinase
MLGDGTTDGASIQRTPVLVPLDESISPFELTAGAEATCITGFNDVGLYCWGANRNGTTGTGSRNLVRSPTQVSFPGLPETVSIRSTAMGDNHACAIANNVTFCWGRNDVGQLGGNDIGEDSNIPQRVSGNLRFATLAAVGNTTCGLVMTDDGKNEVWCWGYGQTGELGNGQAGRNSAVPVRVVAP